MKRRYLNLGFLLLLLLAGCGLTPAAPSETPWFEGAPPRNAAIAQQPITLQVWLAADYVDQPLTQDLMRDFQQAYPNIRVQLQGHVWEEMISDVRLAVTQGNPPDLAHQHGFAMGAQGLAEPLDDLWAGWDAQGEFLASAMEDVTWDGKLYGVPLDINALFMIYNKAMFDQAGLAYPGPGYTFAQLRQDLERLTPPDHSRFGIALSSSGRRMYGIVLSYGGELLALRDGKVVATFDTPEVAEALQYMTDLGRDELGTLPPPQPRQSDHPVALFGARKVALFFSGPFDLARLKQEAPEIYAEVGTARMPVSAPGMSSSSVLGGGSLFVPKGARQREAAFELMKWAVSDRYALRMAKELGRYPVRSALYDDPYFHQEPLLQPFLEELKTSRLYKLEAFASAGQAWSQAVRQAFAPDAHIPTILKQAQQDAERALASGG